MAKKTMLVIHMLGFCTCGFTHAFNLYILGYVFAYLFFYFIIGSATPSPAFFIYFVFIHSHSLIITYNGV